MTKEELQNSKANEIVEEETACTDFIIIGDEVYSENELLLDPLDDLPDEIDEDYFFENFRDEIMFYDTALKNL